MEKLEDKRERKDKEAQNPPKKKRPHGRGCVTLYTGRGYSRAVLAELSAPGIQCPIQILRSRVVHPLTVAVQVALGVTVG